MMWFQNILLAKRLSDEAQIVHQYEVNRLVYCSCQSLVTETTTTEITCHPPSSLFGFLSYSMSLNVLVVHTKGINRSLLLVGGNPRLRIVCLGSLGLWRNRDSSSIVLTLLSLSPNLRMIRHPFLFPFAVSSTPRTPNQALFDLSSDPLPSQLQLTD